VATAVPRADRDTRRPRRGRVQELRNPGRNLAHAHALTDRGDEPLAAASEADDLVASRPIRSSAEPALIPGDRTCLPTLRKGLHLPAFCLTANSWSAPGGAQLGHIICRDASRRPGARLCAGDPADYGQLLALRVFGPSALRNRVIRLRGAPGLRQAASLLRGPQLEVVDRVRASQRSRPHCTGCRPMVCKGLNGESYALSEWCCRPALRARHRPRRLRGGAASTAQPMTGRRTTGGT